MESAIGTDMICLQKVLKEVKEEYSLEEIGTNVDMLLNIINENLTFHKPDRKLEDLDASYINSRAVVCMRLMMDAYKLHDMETIYGIIEDKSNTRK